ncbi:hypothetical protein V8C34DRAFT_279755 [Trichoderma compactum]
MAFVVARKNRDIDATFVFNWSHSLHDAQFPAQDTTNSLLQGSLGSNHFIPNKTDSP